MQCVFGQTTGPWHRAVVCGETVPIDVTYLRITLPIDPTRVYKNCVAADVASSRDEACVANHNEGQGWWKGGGCKGRRMWGHKSGRSCQPWTISEWRAGLNKPRQKYSINLTYLYSCREQRMNIWRFEVFTAGTMKNVGFWDVTPCGSSKNRRFRGTCRLLHQGDKNRWTRNNAICN
jgi:hypothetical protein